MLIFLLFIASLSAADPVGTGAWPDRSFFARENFGPVPVSAVSDEHARAAIVAAVRQRMGAGVDVVVDDLQVQATTGTDLSRAQNLRSGQAPLVEAVPEPGARLDGHIRFILRWSGSERSGARVVRSGAAVARVRVTTTHAHATTIVSRGDSLDAGDVVEARHAIVSGPLRSWPTVADAVGSKALRHLPAEACIVRGAIADQPDVRTGQDVVAVTQVDGIQVSATLVAADSGDAGSVIRVVNHQSRRTLKARIVSPGTVEIVK